MGAQHEIAIRTFRGDQVWYESNDPFLSNHFGDYVITIFRWGSPVGHVPIRSIHHILSKVLSLFHLIGQFQQAGKHPLIQTHIQMIHWLFLVFNFWPIGCQKLNSQSELRIKNWPNFAFRTPSSSISFSIKSCREIVSLSMFRQNPIDPKFDPKWPLPTDFDLDPFDSDFFLWFLALLKCSKMHKNPNTCTFSPNSLFLVTDLLRCEFIIFLSPILNFSVRGSLFQRTKRFNLFLFFGI